MTISGSVYVWHNNCIAYAISNLHPPAEIKTLLCTKGLTESQSLTCLLVLGKYNRNMGTIDCCDRLMSFITTSCRSNKWWHAVVTFFIDVSAINALHLWLLHNNELAQKTTSLRHIWIEGLID